MRAALIAAASACALASAASHAAAGEPVNPRGLPGLKGTDRVIVVSANGMRTTRATARTYERDGKRWRIARTAMPARLGYNGLSWPKRRRQGDGTTPIGNYGFVYGFGSRPDPGLTGFRWRDLVPGACWSGARRRYNRWIQSSACPGENIWSYRHRHYRYAAVMDFNYHRPVYGRGSGIFLHVETGGPTAGCVSRREGDLLPVLRWIRPSSRIIVGPETWLRSLKD